MIKSKQFFLRARAIKNQLDNFGDKFSEDKLIKFDFKVIALIIVVLSFFSLAVVFKIHGSSIPYWNTIISDGSDSREGLIVGSPRSIRSDEWLVQTPFVLSQLNQENKFSIENKSLGDGNAPVLMGLPTKHISTFFRPQNWGFFFLDSERGFSFYWGYKIFAFFLSFFFLLMIVTRSNFWISFFGSAWLFFSSFIQWWFSTSLPETIIAFSIIFIAASYIFISKKKASIIAASFLLAIFTVNFVLVFYPPFQIPLAYLLLFLLAGFLLMNLSRHEIKENLKIRIAGILVSLTIFTIVLSVFYVDTKETISLVIKTVYPGRRVSTGGELAFTQLFSGFYGIFMKQNKFPVFLGNICEASNFVLLFPLAFVVAAFNFISKKKNDFLLLAVLLYLLIMSLWWLVGFPEVISKITLMSFSPPNRTLVGIGVASIISLAVALSKGQEIIRNKRTLFIFLVIVFLLVLAHGLSLRELAPEFIRYRYLLTISIFITLLSYLLLRGKKTIFSLLIAIFVFISTFTVNPISIGLSPIYGKELSRVVKADDQNNMDQLWVIYGKHTLANFLKASGVSVFNGVQYTPKLKSFSILDKSDKNKDVYNRYAHISITEPEQNVEQIQFNVISPDTIGISVDPCSEELVELGINRFLFSYAPDEQKVTCLKPLSKNPISGTWAYTRK